MPFYDLKCKGCKEEFNVMARMSEWEERSIPCPKCGSKDLERIFGNINVIQSRKTPEAPACPNAHKCGGCCGH